MYSWERKFGDIVKDTEKHLSKARHTLKTSSQRNDYSFKDSTSFHRSHTSNNHLPSGSSMKTPSSNWEPRNDRSFGSNQLHSSTTNSDHSSGMVAILSERIDKQGMFIEDLTKQVLALERDKEANILRLRSLEQEVTTLRQRVAEDGVHLQTEQKMDHYQWEMKRKLEDLKHQMDVQGNIGLPVPPAENWMGAITEEVHEMKRHLERECDSLYREIEMIRSKLVRYEADLTGQCGDSRELSRQVDKLKEEFQSNSRKVSVQIDSISNTRQASVELNGYHRNWENKPKYTHTALHSVDFVPISHHSTSRDRRKLKPTDTHLNRRSSHGSTNSHSKHKPITELGRSSQGSYKSSTSSHSRHKPITELASSSTDLSSDSNDNLSQPLTSRPSVDIIRDDSLTLSDLDLGQQSGATENLSFGNGTLSLDSDSLDLDV